ncbi:SDR family oxidoreductase [Methylobacterium oxalidis]|uniref:SDR family oxidoreductase n=1 Tax=Methylobacterium oxalidis TaxID=944322 RepID=UPI003314BBA8
MKIVVMGGSGLIGSKLVARLERDGHSVVAASPRTGVDALTGEGLGRALAGAEIVVDVANSPSFADAAVLDFFERSSRNLLAAGAEAGVRHHVALSVVGTERLLASGYFRAKMAQETLIRAGSIPFTIVRATQFFEFLGGIAESSAEGRTVRLTLARIQPMLSDDVAAALAEIALGPPVDGMVEIAGPEAFPLDALVRRVLVAAGDEREVVTDPKAPYFGVVLEERSLLPGPEARLAPTGIDAWLNRARRPS